VSLGYLAVTVPLGISKVLETSINILIKSQEWSSYFSNFDSGVEFASELQYREILDQHNFVAIKFEIVEQSTVFPCRDSFENYVYQWFIYLQPIPQDFKKVFFKKVIDKYLEIEPPIEDGKIVFRFSRLDILAFKFIP
jgi:trans-aconitate methyltransferase